MSQKTKASKEQLRKKYLQILKNIKPAVKKQWDEAIYQKFIDSTYFTNNEVFALYYSLSYEVSTIKIITTLLEANKKVVLPRMEHDNLVFYYVNNFSDLLVDNQWQIHQPKKDSQSISIADIDVIVVPVIAFNQDYYRLGHGQGYYDRFLVNSNFRALKLGLAYKVQQINENINFINTWDVNFDALITNQ